MYVKYSVPAADTLSRDEFPHDFVFGASTSAYQAEGAANEDGRKPSIWDTFAHAGNGNMYEGDGDIAYDQYHKYKEDVQLMANMGLDAYRFSISWSRVIPDGRGPVNPQGLQYYNNLINELISHGIQAHVILHHWDLPQTLEDEYGGWVSRKIVKDFITYADVCFREFGDRVKYWTTVNEGNVYAMEGYDLGVMPPRRCSPSFKTNCSRGNSSTEPYLVAHHMLLAHASAVRLYKEKYKDMQHGFIGFNLLTFGLIHQSNTSEDISSFQRAQDFLMGWFMNAFTFGDCPDIMKKRAGSRLPSFTQKESNVVRGSIDFLGINFYYSFYVKNSPDSLQNEDTDYAADMSVEMERQQTPRNSSLNDWTRVKYLHAYVGSMLDALRSGLNIKGYFVWSFLDVFEILSGYESSFGLYYVDMNDPSLRRQPKLSAEWYSNFLKRKPMDPKIIKDIEQAPLLHTPLLHHAT
ncbi:hypothetical protein VNO77_20589 [Canavalia gladiata]|uniref:Lactase n=1 Tax=Canavalia gladiata TaxID=3824 RepID=A0AAN9QQQ3_CANGL